MTLSGENLPALCADLDAALGELIASAERSPGLWTQSRPGKWTAGQHAAHVDVAMALMANVFEAAEPALRAGTLPSPPRRGLLQALFVRIVVQKGFLPRGAKAPRPSLPPDQPERDATFAALRLEAGRLRALGERLNAAERDRIWIWNPFITTWHYRLPEAVRVHAVHARHHARMIEEIAKAG